MLGLLKAKTLPLMAGGTALVTILTCYTISSLLGHTPIWLPDITHASRGSPERYIFRLGMSISCFLFVIIWFCVRGWANQVCGDTKIHFLSASNQKLSFIGAGGSMLLLLGSMCIEPGTLMPWTIHTIGASGFFACQIYSIICCTKNIGNAVSEAEKKGSFPSGVSPGAFRVKKACIYAFYSILVYTVICRLFVNSKALGALAEWMATATVMVWVVSLSYDFEASKMYCGVMEPNNNEATGKGAGL